MNARALCSVITSANPNLGPIAVRFCIAAVLVNPVHAGVISLLGDKDCFGVPGAISCPAGSLFVSDLGGTFFTDYRNPLDPAFTDDWATFGTVSYTHTYALPTGITSATLESLRLLESLISHPSRLPTRCCTTGRRLGSSRRTLTLTLFKKCEYSTLVCRRRC